MKIILSLILNIFSSLSSLIACLLMLALFLSDLNPDRINVKTRSL